MDDYAKRDHHLRLAKKASTNSECVRHLNLVTFYARRIKHAEHAL